MNHWGYLITALALAVAVYEGMKAAAARRTVDAEVAWQAERDHDQIITVAIRADQLAAKGHARPGTDAVTELCHPDDDAAAWP